MVSVSCQDLLPSLTSPSLLESLASALQCRMPPSLLPGRGGDRTCCHPEGSGHVLAGSTGHAEGVPLSSAKGEPPKAQLTEAQLRLPDFCLSQDFIPTLEEIEEFLREKAEFLRDDAGDPHPAGWKAKGKPELGSGAQLTPRVHEGGGGGGGDVPNAAGTAAGGQAVAAGSVPVVLQIQPLPMDSVTPPAQGGGVRVAQLLISLQAPNLSLLPQLQPPGTILDQKYVRIAPLPVATGPGDVQEAEAAPGCQQGPPFPAPHPPLLPPRLREGLFQEFPPEGSFPAAHGGKTLHLCLAQLRLEVSGGPRGWGAPAQEQESSWPVEIQGKIPTVLSRVNLWKGS